MATVYECRIQGSDIITYAPAFEIVGATPITANTSLTFDSARFLYLDASGGAFSLTLPASPYEGCTYYLSESVGSGNAITLLGNGKLINGAGAVVLNGAYRQRTIRYNGSQWVFIEGLN